MSVGTGGQAAEPHGPIRLTTEHVDLRIVYAPGTTNELFLVARDKDREVNHAATNVVLVVAEPAQIILPPGFEELGEADSPFWILPASQDSQLLYLGISAEGLPRNTFVEPLTIRLTGVQAPGSFFLWQFDPGGQLVMRMNSRDGIGPEDSTSVIVGSHGHYNWGFSSNGIFEVTFRVEGSLRDATTNLLAADTTFHFAVEPLPSTTSPVRLDQTAVVDDELRCQLTGEPGAQYRLQTSVDVNDWTDVRSVIAADIPVSVSVPLPTNADMLYLRALSP